jgi:hypothetical protein
MRHRIITDRTELPINSYFYLLPGEVSAGELALIEFGDDPKNTIVGRWYPDVAGCNWIVIPGVAIQDTGAIPVRAIGRVVPEDPETNYNCPN